MTTESAPSGDIAAPSTTSADQLARAAVGALTACNQRLTVARRQRDQLNRQIKADELERARLTRLVNASRPRGADT